MTTHLLIVGAGATLAKAEAIARGMGRYGDIVVVEMTTEDGYNFTLPDMAGYPKDQWQAFVAIDERGLNMSRTQTVGELKARGYKLAHLVAPGAVLGDNVTIGENCLVGRGCHVGDATKIVFNSFVCDRAVVGDHCVINKSCYIGRAAMLDDQVTIADGATIGSGVHLHEKTRVGKHSELRHRRSYSGEIADKTFYVDIFPNPIQIVSPF